MAFILSIPVTWFQPSSDLQAGCNPLTGSQLVMDQVPVSTLIRPSGRMQRTDGHTHWALTRFNPHPTFRPDATCVLAGCPDPMGQEVSTLIRPSGRMQHRASNCPAAKSWLFQPSSDLQAGCNGYPPRVQVPGLQGFNPHPTFRPDATLVLEFPICSSRTSSTMPFDGHFWDEMIKSLTRAATRTRTSSVRGRQQWVRVTPPGGR